MCDMGQSGRPSVTATTVYNAYVSVLLGSRSIISACIALLVVTQKSPNSIKVYKKRDFAGS